MLHLMMHFSFFAVVYRFYHLGTDERTFCDDAIDGDGFSEVGGAKSAGVDVIVAERTFETDVEDCVVVDVCVLWRTEDHNSVLESFFEGRNKLSRVIKNASSQNVEERIRYPS